MERKINGELLKWKVDAYKKPLLLYGISECGKTYSALDFGKNEYKNVIYFDCDGNLELNYVFDKNSTLDKLVRALSAISLETIFIDESLIVFDNVNDKILKNISDIFGNSSYHVIMITNDMSMVNKAKGLNVIFKKMNLVSFDEYLKFVGKEQLIAFIEDSFKTDKAMPFHGMAMEVFNDFVICGGYPNAIINYNSNNNYNLLSSVHSKSIKLFLNKLFVFDNLIDVRRSNEVFNNISFQLLKGNRKFLYGMIKSGGRSKEYENSIEFMRDNNIVIKSVRLNSLTSPLSKCRDEDSFKLYYNDSGVLYKKMNVSGNRLLTNDKLMNILYENNIVTALSNNGFNVYHYQSEGKAFIDMVVQTRTGKIIPMEIVSDNINTKSKSLALSMKKYNLSFAIRFTNDNFKFKNGVKYVPYYAAFCVVEGI